MQSTPVIALALAGDDAVDRVRTIIGPTDSKKADKGTVRGDLGVDVMVNIVHASDSPENAEIELERFFEPEELFSYEMSYTNDRKGLMGHADRGAGWRVRVENLSHSPRHADTPVRIRHPRKVACMHPDAAIDPHEIRHRAPRERKSLAAWGPPSTPTFLTTTFPEEST